jgi:spore maturation protein SpmB
MNILANLSNIIIPLLIFYIVAYGISTHVNVYDEFLEGAKSGMQTVISIAPTMIGLMIAVGVLRASGFLDFVGSLCSQLFSGADIPAPIMPLLLIKMFSSSAATGLVLDIFKEYGPDSQTSNLPHHEFDRNHLLHYVRLFYGCKNKENPLHTARCTCCNLSRCDSEFPDRFVLIVRLLMYHFCKMLMLLHL